jgi:hypothetical protein
MGSLVRTPKLYERLWSKNEKSNASHIEKLGSTPNSYQSDDIIKKEKNTQGGSSMLHACFPVFQPSGLVG